MSPSNIVSRKPGWIAWLRWPPISSAVAARAAGFASGTGAVQAARDINGREVIVAAAPISGLAWLVFVELPVAEADAPAR
jgi:hypothetical protein